MYFKITCTNCGKSLRAREETIGRRARCPYCQTMVLVQPPPTVLDEGAAAAAQPDDAAAFSLAALRAEQSARPAAAAPAPPRRATRTPAVASDSSDGTNVNFLLTGLVGLTLTSLFYVALLPFPGVYLHRLFYERGWVPPVEALLFFWALSILFFKTRKLRRQKDSMLFDVLPGELSERISLSTLDQFTDHVRSLPINHAQSFLLNRVLRGLEHFRVRRSAADVAGMLSSQSDIDSNAVGSSYTLVKVFIGVIPILGFIGTVQGLGAAVGGFAGELDKAADIAVLKNSLNNITGGLAVAFDTTLIALVMSVLLMFPTSSMQKSEEDLLNWVDEYCNENLLRRVYDGGNDDDGAPTISAEYKKAMQKAIDSALAAHHAELQVWTRKLEAIGGTISQQVAEGWSVVMKRAQEQQQQLAAAHQQQLERAAATQHQQVELVHQAVASMAERAAAAQQQITGSLDRSHAAMQEQFAAVERGVTALADVLQRLGDKQILIHVQPPARRNWFRFGRKNGENTPA